MNNKDKKDVITVFLILYITIAIMIILIQFNIDRLNNKLENIENDVKKRPTIEYHYYEREIPKVK